MYPPSTRTSVPVTKLAASDSRKVTGPAKSCGSPMRPMGVPPTHFSLRSGRSSRIFSVLRGVLEAGLGGARHEGKEGVGDLQRGAHVAGRDAVDPDVVGGPLDGQRGREVLDGRLGRVVRPGLSQLHCSRFQDIQTRAPPFLGPTGPAHPINPPHRAKRKKSKE